MMIQNRLLLTAGAALCLALPGLALAQANPAAQPPTDTAAPAAAAAPASASAPDQMATKDYPRCSKTVTDNCMQGSGGSSHKAKARHSRGSHHRAKSKS